MLIIDEKIIILHMKKCGGTSFCRGLIDCIDNERLEFYGYTKEGEDRSAKSKDKGGLWKHSTAREARVSMGAERYDKLQVWFVATRPYWDRVASFYYYAKRHNDEDATKYTFAADLSFSDYINSRYMLKDKITDFVCDDHNKCIVDRIVRYEEIQRMYSRLVRKLGIENHRIPSLNANPTPQNYVLKYSGDDWAHLARKFKDEIEFLNTTTRLAP